MESFCGASCQLQFRVMQAADFVAECAASVTGCSSGRHALFRSSKRKVETFHALRVWTSAQSIRCIKQDSAGCTMPKRGIHPILHTMTYVMKNGASRQVLTTKKMALPYILIQVGYEHVLALLNCGSHIGIKQNVAAGHNYPSILDRQD